MLDARLRGHHGIRQRSDIRKALSAIAECTDGRGQRKLGRLGAWRLDHAQAMQLATHLPQQYLHSMNAMIAMTDIALMSVDERLHTMEMLWQSLSATPDSIESPQWHGDVLADRLARVEAGQARFLLLEVAKARLARR